MRRAKRKKKKRETGREGFKVCEKAFQEFQEAIEVKLLYELACTCRRTAGIDLACRMHESISCIDVACCIMLFSQVLNKERC